jgi:hypothetical protein
MIRLAASRGGQFVYDVSDEACATAQLVLGLRQSRHFEGPRVPVKVNSIRIASLDQIEEDPDLILTTVTPKQMMDLTLLINAGNPGDLTVGFRGEAACAEFTAKPYREQRANLSLLCYGARFVYSNYRDNELLFSAPPSTYLTTVDTIESLAKTGGALCGCRTSDIPQEVIEAFERAGFAKGTDYFFGRIDGQGVRVYLAKDAHGRFDSITFHIPSKLDSAENAERHRHDLTRYFTAPFTVRARGPWLDIALHAKMGELSIDLLDHNSLRTATDQFIRRTRDGLRKVRLEARA